MMISPPTSSHLVKIETEDRSLQIQDGSLHKKNHGVILPESQDENKRRKFYE